MDDALIERLDRLVKVMKVSPDYEGLDINRSVAIRSLVMRGLAAAELRLGITDDLPKDMSVATQAYWNRREQESEQELEAIRRFIDEWDQEYRSALIDATGEVLKPTPPRSRFYKDKLKGT